MQYRPRNVHKALLPAIGLIFFFINSQVSAARIGGSGGVANEDIQCVNGQYATGIEVTRSSALERIRLQCRKHNRSGHWSGSPRWTSMTPTTNVRPANRKSRGYCPQNKWVTGFSAKINNGVLTGLKLHCSTRKYNAGPMVAPDSNRWQTLDTEKVGVNYSASSSKQRTTKCGRGVVNRLNVRYGFFLDSIAPWCSEMSPPQRMKVKMSGLKPSFSSTSIAVPVSPAKAQFRFRRNKGPRFEICISEVNRSGCMYRVNHQASGYIELIETALPASMAGNTYQWKIRQCTVSQGLVKCGEWSDNTRFAVLPQAIRLTFPANNQKIMSRNVTLKWKKSSAADSYRIMLLDYRDGNIPSFFRDPEMRDIPGKRQIVKVDRNVSSVSISLNRNMPSKLRVKIAACVNVQGKGRQCADSSPIVATFSATTRTTKTR